jgi:uncharacterized phage infection (PIP) family protein YhgE
MYCPPPFLGTASGCVYDCDSEPGYTTRLGTQPRCARQENTTQGFDLKPLPQIPLQWSSTGFLALQTLDQLRTRAPDLYALFEAEQTRAKAEVAKLNAELGRDTLLQAAFEKLQTAENARDEAPEAYQQARTEYYTLLKGDTWLSEEKERITKAEVEPAVQKYQNDYVALTTQIDQQKQAYDIMQGIKDKVFQVRDDLQYSANLLMGQVRKVQSQIELERRKTPETPNWVSWFNIALDLLLLVALGVASWFVFQKLRSPASPTAYTQGSLQT